MLENVDLMATPERIWDEPQKVQVSSIRLAKLSELHGRIGIDASLVSTTGGVAQCNTNLVWVVHF